MFFLCVMASAASHPVLRSSTRVLEAPGQSIVAVEGTDVSYSSLAQEVWGMFGLGTSVSQQSRRRSACFYLDVRSAEKVQRDLLTCGTTKKSTE